MAKSIINNDKVCYICGTTQNIEKHHIFEGGYKPISEKYGCWCFLCAYHHRLQGGISHNPIKEIDRYLKKVAQEKFEEKYGHDKYMATFRRDYINGKD